MKSFALALLLSIASSAPALAAPVMGATATATIGIRVSVRPRFLAKMTGPDNAVCLQSNYRGPVMAGTPTGQILPLCEGDHGSRIIAPVEGIVLVTPQ